MKALSALLAVILGSASVQIALLPAGSTSDQTTAATGSAIFAGGCFWCMEQVFEELPGVTEVVSGYTGGRTVDPTYDETSSGSTGHAEAVRVTFDPSKITYAQLLDAFWHNVDPLTPNAQFCDVGSQYRSAIFPLDESQRTLAEASRRALERSGRFASPIVTEIVTATMFYPAEGYHQDYYQKNPVRYKYYKWSCGRAQRLKQLWGAEVASAVAP